MKTPTPALLLCAALALGAAGCDDGAETAADTAPRDMLPSDAGAEPLATLQAELEGIVADQAGPDGFPGIGLTVVLADGRTLTASAGHVGPAADAADYSTDGTVQVIGSVSKLFTAVLVMQRVERGALALDDTIDRWFDFDGAGSITVRMLLDHTAGLADCVLLIPAERRAEVWSPEALIELAVAAEPQAAPGGATAWYSNTHYVLLARIVEALDGQSWSDAIAEHITGPLQLADVGYAGDAGRAGAFAHGWYHDGDGWADALDVIDPSIGWGMGALVASGHDLATFGRALFDGALFDDPATLARMQRFEHPLADSLRAVGEPPQTLGLGIIRYALGGDAALDGHFGRTLGYQAGIFHDPATDTLITISANVDGVQVGLAAIAAAGAVRTYAAQ